MKVWKKCLVQKKLWVQKNLESKIFIGQIANMDKYKLTWQISTWKLASVKDSPRNNWDSNSDISDMDRCHQDKCHGDSLNLF